MGSGSYLLSLSLFLLTQLTSSKGVSLANFFITPQPGLEPQTFSFVGGRATTVCIIPAGIRTLDL